MKRILSALLFAAALVTGTSLAVAQEPPEHGNKSIVRIEVRPGVHLNYFAKWREDAKATLVLFSGGAGGMGRISTATGWPSSNNFLIRSAPTFQADGPFNIVLVGRASDIAELGYTERISDQHFHDNEALLRSVKQHSGAPIWIIGTSRGTVSVAALAIRDTESLVSGVVLTSSVTNFKVQGAVPTQDLSKIHVPTLVLHHEHDACKMCPPSGVSWIMSGLKNAPIKSKIMVSGGEDKATGDPCEALHTHGYAGIEPQVVSIIAAWVLTPKGE